MGANVQGKNVQLSAEPVRYIGSKRGRVARWIVANLPPVRRHRVYCEPFAGMAGVLLRRRPAEFEVINDLDDRIVNWWRVVRDQPAELIEKLRWTPHARTEWARASAELMRPDEPAQDPVHRAWNATIVLWSSYIPILPHRDRHENMYWCQAKTYQAPEEVIEKIARRIRRVGLDCQPALDIIARARQQADTLLYCDPPYPSSEIARAYDLGFSAADFIELVRDARAAMAISGYPGDFDALEQYGFSRTSIPKMVTITRRPTPVREVLWTNYPPCQPQFELG